MYEVNLHSSAALRRLLSSCSHVMFLPETGLGLGLRKSAIKLQKISISSEKIDEVYYLVF